MIQCPHCGSTESTVKEVKSFPDFNRRYRVCSKCHNTYTTEEVLAVYAGRKRGMVRTLPQVVESDG